MDALPTQPLFGCEFVAVDDVSVVADALLDDAARPRSAWRCAVTPNVDHLVRYERSAGDAQVAIDATMVLPDGMPIVWASRLLGRRLPARLTGSDLFAELWPRLAAGDVPCAVLASGEEVADGLRREHPRAEVLVAPMFDVDDEPAVTAVVDRVAEACTGTGARILVLGVSMPKHHLLARRLHDRWADGATPRPYVLLLGASADLYVGTTRRAPRWMQRSGLEWLHRLGSDPRRMARRYLVDDPAFLGMVWREWRLGRRSGVPR